MPDGWTIHKVAAFVRDLAMNMYTIPVILKKHTLTEAQYAVLVENDFFKKALEAATIEWNSPHSTTKRLAMEAAIGLEDAMPTITARMSSKTELLPAVVECAKLFAKMAGVGETTQQGPVGEKFKIVINLGADTLKVEKHSAPLTVEGSESTVFPLIEGTRETPPV